MVEHMCQMRCLAIVYYFYTIFVSSHMYSENLEGTRVIVGSMNMGYISDTARNRTHNMFRPRREPIPLGHSDEHVTVYILANACLNKSFETHPSNVLRRRSTTQSCPRVGWTRGSGRVGSGRVTWTTLLLHIGEAFTIIIKIIIIPA